MKRKMKRQKSLKDSIAYQLFLDQRWSAFQYAFINTTPCLIQTVLCLPQSTTFTQSLSAIKRCVCCAKRIFLIMCRNLSLGELTKLGQMELYMFLKLPRHSLSWKGAITLPLLGEKAWQKLVKGNREGGKQKMQLIYSKRSWALP